MAAPTSAPFLHTRRRALASTPDGRPSLRALASMPGGHPSLRGSIALASRDLARRRRRPRALRLFPPSMPGGQPSLHGSTALASRVLTRRRRPRSPSRVSALTLASSIHDTRRATFDVTFDSSVLGIGEVCKAIICLEIVASKFQVIFDRAEAVRMSGMSEKAYIRSFNALQNGLGVKTTLDVCELGIQFGCARLIPFVQKGLPLYKERFLAALPPSRWASTDFGRPVFTAAAFYLCSKRHTVLAKSILKVDKLKLIDLCGTYSSEFITEFILAKVTLEMFYRGSNEASLPSRFFRRSATQGIS